MHPSRTQSTSDSVLSMPTRRSLRRAWLVLTVGLVCAWGSVSATAKPMSETAVQSRTLRTDEAGVVLQTRNGDSLREIAQYYSRQNNIPFQRALALLIQTNQAQFPNGDPDRMQVGTQLVLPNAHRADGASASVAANSPTTAPETKPPVAETPPVVATPAQETKASPAPSAPAQNEVAATVSKAPSSEQADAGVVAQLKAWLLGVPKSIGLIIIAFVGALVWFLTRSTRQKTESGKLEPERIEPSSADPESMSASVVQQSDTDGQPQNEPTAPHQVDIARAQVMPKAEATLPQAVATTVKAQETPEFNDAEEDTSVEVQPYAAQEIEHRFKQALHGLTADQLDLRGSASQISPQSTIQPAVAAAKVVDQTATPNLNVNHLLRQYANHSAEKAGQTANYYALSERTRLQKWMSTQSIDDLLDHAQKAYAQSYPNVAQHILNEVILRGDATQSTHALDLRNQWHIQYLRQQAQESRGH